MIEALSNLRTDPARLVCVVLVLCLAAYFAVDAAMIVAKLDFGAADLGRSEVSDFFVFYSSARFLDQGGAIASLYDPEVLRDFQVSLGAGTEGLHTFNYPPHYALLIQPLAALPYPVALICWQVGTLALFILSLRLAGLRRFEVLAAVAAPASILNFSAGQNGYLTSALLVAGMALLTRRPAAAGALFGLLTVKPHLGLLIPIAALAKRQWTAVSTAAAVTAGLVGLGCLAYGIGIWADYLDYLRWFAAKFEAATSGSFLDYSTSAMVAAQIAGLSRPAATLLQAALSLFVCVCVYWAYRQRGEAELQLALMLVGTGLAMPHGYFYDLPFVAVAVILVARHGLREGFLPYEGFWALWVFLLPFAGPLMNEHRLALAPVVHLVFFGYILARLRLRKPFRSFSLGQPRRARDRSPAPTYGPNAKSQGSA